MSRKRWERYRPSVSQVKILTRLTNGWRLSSVPRSYRQFFRSFDEKLNESQFGGLRNQGWIEPDGDVPHQWRISDKGREALARADVPLCH